METLLTDTSISSLTHFLPFLLPFSFLVFLVFNLFPIRYFPAPTLLFSSSLPFILYLPFSHIFPIILISLLFSPQPLRSSLLFCPPPSFFFYPKHTCCLFLHLPSLPKAKRQFSFLCSSLGCRVSRLPQQTMLR